MAQQHGWQASMLRFAERNPFVALVAVLALANSGSLANTLRGMTGFASVETVVQEAEARLSRAITDMDVRLSRLEKALKQKGIVDGAKDEGDGGVVVSGAPLRGVPEAQP